MKRCLLILALATVLGPISARAERYTIDPANSRIAFSVRHLLGTARGQFHKFSGTIEIDPSRPERSSVEVKIQVASLDTKIRKRDDHLLSRDFFDAEQFPEITFRSRKVTQTGTNTGDIVGSLTVREVTRPVTLHVKLAASAAAGEVPRRTRWVVTTDPIRRKDFNLMFGSTAEAVSGIGQEVLPAIEIEAVRE